MAHCNCHFAYILCLSGLVMLNQWRSYFFFFGVVLQLRPPAGT